jgi:transcriptional regulator with XRE-family HTH domain
MATIERGKLGAVLRAVRVHRGESQDDVGARAGQPRAKVAQVELGLNQATTAKARRWVAVGWSVSKDTVDALADGETTTGLAADAFRVPEDVLVDAVRDSTDLATEAP